MQSSKGVKVEPWGEKPGVQLYTLSRGGMTVRITNWGATIVSLCLSDDTSGPVDVVLGFDSIKPYMDGSSPYFGCIVGRVANRIKEAKFTLDGENYNLPANNNSNTLHGGEVGYDKVLWGSRILDSEDPAVEFTYSSFDGEQGFPGDLDVTVVYKLLAGNQLRVDMKAAAKTKATPVSLAQHTYWNLGGHNSGTVLDHTLRVAGSRYLPVDELQIPTGELLPVSGSAFDFYTQSAPIGSRLEQVEGGYDHNYVLDGEDRDSQGLHSAAELYSPQSGWSMELRTDAPGMQVYSGNFLDNTPGKGGCVYKRHAAVCLETQGFPNAVNQARFPSVVIPAGGVYQHVMLLSFSRKAA